MRSQDSSEVRSFKKLCIKNNDVTYKGMYIDYHIGTLASDMNFTNINIVSDRDFDETHPKGSSLNDIVTFISLSPYKFIKSGYTNNYDWDRGSQSDFFKDIFSSKISQLKHHNQSGVSVSEELEGIDKMYHPIEKRVSDLKLEDLTLLGGRVSAMEREYEWGFNYFAVFQFIKIPTLSKSHNLVITFTTDDGRVKESSVELKF